MDCKEALTESSGDFDKAIEYLRKKGLSAATKRSSRAVKEGIIESYIHLEGKIGVLLELNCETDFVARTEGFKQLAHDIAMHVAAMNPAYVNPDDVPAAILEQEREIYRTQAVQEGKPEKILDKIIDGKLKKYYEDVCLLSQKFVKDTDITIETLVNNFIGNTGENVLVRRFVRYQLGADQD